MPDFVVRFARLVRGLVPVGALLLTTPLLAQREAFDYALTVRGDTLRGYLREKNNETIALKTSQNGSETIYDVTQLLGYQIDGIPRLSARWINDTLTGATQQAFVRVVTPGYVSLWGFNRSSWNPEQRLGYLLRLPDGTFHPLRGQEAWLMLKLKLVECEAPAFLEALDVKYYNYSLPYFDRLVRLYNRCTRPGETVRMKREPFRWALGLTGGAAVDFWIRGTSPGSQLYGDPNGAYSPLVQPVIGPQFSLLLGKRTSVQLEMFYDRYQGKRTVEYDFSFGRGAAHHRVEETYLTLPISLQYALTDRALRWYLRAGLLPNRRLETRVYSARSNASSTVVYPETLDFQTTAQNNFGFVLGTGVEKRLSTGARRARLELRGTVRSSNRGAAALATAPAVQLLGSVDLLGSRR